MPSDNESSPTKFVGRLSTSSRNDRSYQLNTSKRNSIQNEKLSIPKVLSSSRKYSIDSTSKPFTRANSRNKRNSIQLQASVIPSSHSEANLKEESFNAKTLYFSQVSHLTFDHFSKLCKEYSASRIDVDPSDGQFFSGKILFKTRDDTERAFAILNNTSLPQSPDVLKLTTVKNALFKLPGTRNLIVKHLPKDVDIVSLYDFLRVAGPIFSIDLLADFACNSDSVDKSLEASCLVKYFYLSSEKIALNELQYGSYKGNIVTISVSHNSSKSRSPSKRSSVLVPTDKPQNFEANTKRTNSEITSGNIADLKELLKANFDSANCIREPEPKSQSQSNGIRSSSLQTSIGKSQRNSPESSRHSLNYTKTLEKLSSNSATLSPKSPTIPASPGSSQVPTSCNLIVKNLDLTVSHSELFELFKQFGYLYSARVKIDHSTGKSLGYGYAQFGSEKDADIAIESLKDIELKGSRIQISKDSISELQASKINSRVLYKSSGSGSGSDSQQTAIVSCEPTAQPESLSFDVISNNTTTNTATKLDHTQASKSDMDITFDPSFLKNLSIQARTELLAKSVINSLINNKKIDIKSLVDEKKRSGQLLPFLARVVCCMIAIPSERILEILKSEDLTYQKWIESQENHGIPIHDEHLAVVKQSWISNLEANCWTTQRELEQDPVENGFGSYSPYSHSNLNSNSNSNLNGVSNLNPNFKTPPSKNASDFNPLVVGTQGLALGSNPKGKTGIKIKGYDSNVENFIEDLKMMPVLECKKELGSKIMPLLKYLGFKDAAAITCWLLDNMINDVRKLSYAINDAEDLSELANFASTQMDLDSSKS